MVNDVLSGVIKFVQAYTPALDAGVYNFSYTQTVSSQSKKNAFKEDFPDSQTFFVKGARFILGSEVIDVFPPNSMNGEYSNVLPHIVLEQRTYPWQRTCGAVIETDADQNRLPFLALLVFDQSDPAT